MALHPDGEMPAGYPYAVVDEPDFCVRDGVLYLVAFWHSDPAEWYDLDAVRHGSPSDAIMRGASLSAPASSLWSLASGVCALLVMC